MSKSCYMMAAGKLATADGSVLVGRSADVIGGDDICQVRVYPRKRYDPGTTLTFPGVEGVEIPQIEETFSYLGIMLAAEGYDQAEAEGGINEHQVIAGCSTGGWLNPKAQEVCPKMSTSIGDWRMNLVLERCRTALEGVELVGELTDKYGARTDNYIFADPQEAWLFEEFQQNLWCAVRIPDDAFFIEANSVRIDFVDFDHPDRFRGSKNLISFAKEQGLYEDSDGPFNPAKVYGAQTGKIRHGIPAPEYDRRRIWRGISLWAPSTNLDPEDPSWVYPLFVRPEWKLTPKDVLMQFTDHYQGTPYDPYGTQKDKYRPTVSPMIAKDDTKYPESKFHINEHRQYQLAPIWSTERLIGTARSGTNWCAQARNWMPNAIGGLLWNGLSEGATTARVPFYASITRTPEPYNHGLRSIPLAVSALAWTDYDSHSAAWKFRVVTNLVNLFYTATKDEVISIWREWEETNYKLQPVIENVALELYEQDPDLAIEFLTTYSNSKASEALEMAEKMINRLHTIISHYNAPL